jgi:hypothetical protein
MIASPRASATITAASTTYDFVIAVSSGVVAGLVTIALVWLRQRRH